MGEPKRNPKIAGDGTVPMTVRLPPELRARLLERADHDGMQLGALIIRLVDFGLSETETVFRRKGSPPAGAEIDVTTAEPRRRAGGARS